jgi:site-specific DNA-methyltransferase (adenine-specific)
VSWTLHHGSCLDPITGLASLADKSIDHIVTDPPYSQHTHDRTWQAKTLGRKTIYEGINFAHLEADHAYEVAKQASRVCRRWFLAFTDMEGIALWRDAVLTAGLDYVRTCLWVKPDATPQFTGDRPASGAEAFVLAHPTGRKKWNAGGKRNVYTHNRPGGDSPHPTTKPLALMRELIEDFTNPGDLVLDPFAGSGSTGVACNQLGRNFLGWELSSEYHAIACRRLNGDEAKPNPAQPSLFGTL